MDSNLGSCWGTFFLFSQEAYLTVQKTLSGAFVKQSWVGQFTTEPPMLLIGTLTELFSQSGVRETLVRGDSEEN